MKNTKFMRRLLGSTMIASLAITATSPAFAQDAGAEENEEASGAPTIVVQVQG